ncbi:MAG: glutamate racemase [Candidatus Schekmanbacteria bacterium]|nr:MAG: glutamate racemase [Candidatus Schekmanbacteria bacterium]
MNKGSIGIFDSGIGGLSVFREIASKLPKEDIIYLGDTARVPYGTKSEETVKRYALQNVKFLIDKKIKILVVACNTASAYAIEAIQSEFEIPVTGVIKPGVEAAYRISKKRKIGVIGTKATISSGAYERELKKLMPECEIYTTTCPLFVALAEEAMFDNEITTLTVKHYLEDLKRSGIDTLILGCTHYPFLKKAIGRFMGEDVQLIDSSIETAAVVKKILLDNSLMNSENSEGKYEIFVTDDSSHFRKTAEIFLDNYANGKLHRIDI